MLTKMVERKVKKMITEITEEISEVGKRNHGLVSTLFFDRPLPTEIGPCYEAQISTRFLSRPNTTAFGYFVEALHMKRILCNPTKAKDAKEARQNHYKVIDELKESYLIGEKFKVR